MADAAHLVEITRGPIIESRHRGHAVIARANGEIVEAWGDPAKVVLPRSSAKMLQALPLLESGAGAGLTTERLALACASHSGETRHVEKVSEWLSDIGLTEEALICGPEVSRDLDLRDEMIRERKDPTRLHNNCSGKHTGFLMLSKHLRAGPNYVDPDHPVQRAVVQAFEEMCGEDSAGYGIDGCSAPNFAASLAGIATAMARFASMGDGTGARDKAVVALREAMISHPELVSGRGRACAELMRAAKGRAAVKTGAEGFFIAIIPDLGIGIALKIEDGATRASEIVIAALLTRLGVIEAGDPVGAGYLSRPVLNRSGAVVGEERPAPGLLPN